MTTYPVSYHKAIYHLVAFGSYEGDTKNGRHLIARALVDLRHTQGRKQAMWERWHMLYISGQFPVKYSGSVPPYDAPDPV
jgi:hypothetical protein